MTNNRVKLNLTMDEELVKQIKIYAIHDGRSISEITEMMWVRQLWGNFDMRARPISAIVREKTQKDVDKA